MKEEIGSQCRLYKQHEETIDHLTSGWPILAKNKYLMRHDRPGAFLHYSICKAIGIEKTKDAQTHTHAHAHTHTHTHTHRIQYVNMEMEECYGIKRQNLQQIRQINN